MHSQRLTHYVKNHIDDRGILARGPKTLPLFPIFIGINNSMKKLASVIPKMNTCIRLNSPSDSDAAILFSDVYFFCSTNRSRELDNEVCQVSKYSEGMKREKRSTGFSFEIGYNRNIVPEVVH